ncbi:tetra-peptide repeat homeobox protein 1-like [Nylanderia fulva]|uniref:tetra-peptide repeat homeobox protein 1-like n=1 Tax=Nylanderia fulva TaxID=613905 RepID=UPI0010FB18DB|nr:tetra-peptide repeat homeobox protein 1-like [Nylanderia fulva]
MNKLVILCALVVLALAEERKSDDIKKPLDKDVKKDKRGLYGSLGYGYGIGDLGYSGYGIDGLSAYSSLPIGLSSPSIHTTSILTKEVAVPVPQPVAVPVEKHVPVPVKVPYAVPVDRPYPVHVPKPYPVEVTKHVPVPVDRPVAVPYSVPVKVPVPAPYAVKVPQPYAVPVIKHVPVPVATQPLIYSKPILNSGLGYYGGYSSSW